jgi:threonine dehydratase
VLAGFEVGDADLSAFTSFLDELGYPYTSEHDNPAYQFFLG